MTEYTIVACLTQLRDVFDPATVFHRRQCLKFDTAIVRQSVLLKSCQNFVDGIS